MKKCPFFGMCGGCQFDFSLDDYKIEKLKLLGEIKPDEVIWISDKRRRAEFSFLDKNVGFFKKGSNDIIAIDNCPLLSDNINKILSELRKLSFAGGGSILVSGCDNGIAIDANANAAVYPIELKNVHALRITWNERVIKDGNPTVLGRIFPSNGFLQATTESEKIMREFVQGNVRGRIADLFSGIGTLTIGLKADGFDSFKTGYGKVRNLFKNPLTEKEFLKYESIVLDPPRGGAKEQCIEIAKTKLPVVYMSCNPTTWLRDKKILEQGGYNCDKVIAIDQFVGTGHWEIASVFTKK